MSNRIINWANVFGNSSTFQNNKPFPFGFVEDVFYSDFYDKLFETYPKVDSKWTRTTKISRSATKRPFGTHDPKFDKFPPDQEDESLSPEWNKFFHYLYTEEFMKNISEYTGIKLTKLCHFHFIYRQKGDFDMIHTHHPNMDSKDYEYKVTILAYFANGWKNGMPGGTYIASEEDESSIIFEPYNLRNSWTCFAESPHSWHGSRYITHDIPRPSIQFTLF